MKMDKMVLSCFLLGGKQPIMLNTFRPDVCEIADKVQVLLTDTDLRHKMGSAGREKIEREFTLEVFEKRMTWILEHIVYPIFSRMGIERD